MIGYSNLKMRLGGISHLLQGWLFPKIEENIGELDEKDKLFINVTTMFDPHPLLANEGWCGNGRPRISRVALLNSFILKATRNIPTTKELVCMLKSSGKYRLLCGFNCGIPVESTFSRAFARFAELKIGEKGLAQITSEQLAGTVAFNGSLDATEIAARERPTTRKPEPGGRRPGGKQVSRLQTQATKTLEENLAELPTECAVGCKRNSKGNMETWHGYKAHVFGIDGDIPVAFILTSANLHDSQAAIPLAQMAAQRVKTLYSLMDAGYDAAKIKSFERSLGHVPIIDCNPRRGILRKMPDDRAARYKARSGIERVNSHVKDAHGANSVWVRGHAKVAFHLSLGFLVIAVEQLLKLA